MPRSPNRRAWVKQAVSRRFIRLAYYCLSELQLEDARGYARTALRYHPTNKKAWIIAAASMIPAPALNFVRRMKSGGKGR